MLSSLECPLPYLSPSHGEGRQPRRTGRGDSPVADGAFPCIASMPWHLISPVTPRLLPGSRLPLPVQRGGGRGRGLTCDWPAYLLLYMQVMARHPATRARD